MNRWEKWAELPHHHAVKLHGHHGMDYLHPLYLEDFSQNALCWEDLCPEICQQLPFLNPMETVSANSCGGLLFFYACGDPYHGKFFLFNPTTNQWSSFFDKCNNRSHIVTGALGYDRVSDDFKMVRVCCEAQTYRKYAEVLSLKTDKQNWREIEAPLTDYNRITVTSEHVYVAAAGKSYWSASGAVVSFDYSDDTFSHFDFPPLPYLYCEIARVLVKLHDGLLGVVCYWMRGSGGEFDDEYPGYYYELWAWREAEMEWYRMFDPVCLCGGAREPLGLIDGRLLLLRGLYHHSNKINPIVLVYDWTTKQCFDPRLSIGSCISWVAHVFSYVETTYELPPPLQGELTRPRPRPRPRPPQQEEEQPTSLRPLYFRLNKVYRGSDGKAYEYGDPDDIQYEDWSINGFRVVNEYHPSEDKYVFNFDFEGYALVEIRERGLDYPDDGCCKDRIIKYVDELQGIDEFMKEMKINRGPSQTEQPIDHDNERRKREDQKTVCVYGIPVEKSEMDVLGFFSKAGKVKNVDCSIDEKSRVVWHIEFDDSGSVPMARALSGLPCFGQALVVVLDKLVNRAQRLPSTQTSTKTICLQNLPSTVSESHLYKLFNRHRYGCIIRILRQPDCAYVKFSEAGFANEAQLFDGQLQMADKSIKVSLVEDILDADPYLIRFGSLDCLISTCLGRKVNTWVIIFLQESSTSIVVKGAPQPVAF
ncbi:hypothetical protein OROMI_022203 [Orobanche minor]